MFTFSRRLGLFCLSFLLCAPSADAQEKVLNVAAFQIANVLEPDGSGYYDQVLAEVSKRTNIKFNVQVLPVARARESYNHDRFDCLIPLDPVFEGRHQDHVTSVPLYEANLYAITLKSNKIIRDLETLRTKAVAGEIGIPYTQEIQKIVGNKKNPALIGAINMLQAGRVDAIVAYTPDITELMEHEGINNIHFDPASPIATYRDSLTCRPTAENIKLMDLINKALTDILVSEKLLEN